MCSRGHASVLALRLVLSFDSQRPCGRSILSCDVLALENPMSCSAQAPWSLRQRERGRGGVVRVTVGH